MASAAGCSRLPWVVAPGKSHRGLRKALIKIVRIIGDEKFSRHRSARYFCSTTLAMDAPTVIDPYALASEFILHTSRSVFLTGKAGTGKTTLLKRIRESTGKKCVVL